MSASAPQGSSAATTASVVPPLPGYVAQTLGAERARLAQQVRALFFQQGLRWPTWIDARPGRLQLLLANCVDAPLSATRGRWLAQHADRIAEGLAGVALALSAPRIALWLPAAARSPAPIAGVPTLHAPPAFPTQPEQALPAGEGRAWSLPAEQLVALSVLLRPEVGVERSPPLISVVGAVAAPAVLPVTDPSLTARQLVARAGGATTAAWVPLLSDPLAGPLWEADRPLPIAGPGDAPTVLYVLPAGHPLIRRHRASFSVRQRAANTCQSCRLCTDLCPTASGGTTPHLLMRALGQASPLNLSAETLAMTAGCTRCGACSVACPAGLLPGAIVAAFAAALPGGESAGLEIDDEPPPPADLARLPWSLVLARLGLDGFVAAQP